MLLRNPRHESFARAVADGHSATEAHRIAGFCVDRGNAARLLHRDSIARRIDEILATRTKAVDKALVTAAAKAGVDQLWVLRDLKRNAIMSARHGDRAAANRALELLGKHLGLFVDLKSIEIEYVDDSDEYLAKLMDLVQGKIVDNELPAINQRPAERHDGDQPSLTTYTDAQ